VTNKVRAWEVIASWINGIAEIRQHTVNKSRIDKISPAQQYKPNKSNRYASFHVSLSLDVSLLPVLEKGDGTAAIAVPSCSMTPCMTASTTISMRIGFHIVLVPPVGFQLAACSSPRVSTFYDHVKFSCPANLHTFSTIITELLSQCLVEAFYDV
jgi:hypothetical protein